MDFAQICIAVFGTTAIYLVSRRDHLQRWGYIFGLCSQPFWFYTSWEAHQWGIFALSFWYAFSWANGVL
ncbi:MAG: hypothetical protein ABFD76_05100 [Smithella sp.]